MIFKRFVSFIFILFVFFITIYASKAQTWYKYWGNPGYNYMNNILFFENNYYSTPTLIDDKDSTLGFVNFIKMDISGNIIFSKLFSNDNSIKVMHEFCMDNEGNFVGVLSKKNDSNWDAMISKFDKNGNVIYLKRIFPENTSKTNYLSVVYTIEFLNTGNFAVGGYKAVDNIDKFWIGVLNSNGNIIKSNLLFQDLGYSNCQEIIKLKTSGFLAVGYRENISMDTSKIALVKFNDDGDVLWINDYSDGNYESIYPFTLAELNNGSIIIAGKVSDWYPITKSDDAYIAKYSPDGDFLWEKKIGSKTENKENYRDEIQSITKTPDGGFIAAGRIRWKQDLSENKLWISKFTADGEQEWDRIYVHPDGKLYGELKKIITTDDGGYLAVGITGNFYGWDNIDTKVLVMKLDENGICDLVSIHSDNQMKKGFILYQNYPNPFNPTTTIKFNLKKNNLVKLVVSNTKGQYIETLVNKNLSIGKHSFDFNATNLDSGIYYYTLQVGNEKITKKMLLVK